MEMKTYNLKMSKLQDNLTKLYTILWDQCDPGMQAAIAKKDTYFEAEAMMNAFTLLAIIDELCQTGKELNYYVQKIEASRNLLCFRQKNGMTMAEYLKEFIMLVTIAKKHEVLIADTGNVRQITEKTNLSHNSSMSELLKEMNKAGIDKTLKATLAERIDTVLTAPEDRYLGVIFAMNSNEETYALYKQDCANSDVTGTNMYPTSVVMAHGNLQKYKCNRKIPNEDHATTTRRTPIRTRRNGISQKERIRLL